MIDYTDLARTGGQREVVIARDNSRCVKCYMARDQHKAKFGVDITIDHIDGRGIHYAKQDKNNLIDNLQTLCLTCHGLKDSPKKLNAEDVADIKMFNAKGMTPAQISRGYQMVSRQTMYDIIKGKSWRVDPQHLYKEPET